MSSDTIESCIWIRTDTRSLSIVSRAKSEALDNIYSFLKQNIKSCNAKRRRQRERWKTTIGLISKKSNFARVTYF